MEPQIKKEEGVIYLMFSRSKVLLCFLPYSAVRLQKKVNIQIMNAFVAMRRFLLNNARIFTEIDSIKQHLIASDIHQKESDQRIDALFTLMDRYKIEDKQGVFVQGQIYDAYIRNASASQSWRMPGGSKQCSKRCRAGGLYE